MCYTGVRYIIRVLATNRYICYISTTVISVIFVKSLYLGFGENSLYKNSLYRGSLYWSFKENSLYRSSLYRGFVGSSLYMCTLYMIRFLVKVRYMGVRYIMVHHIELLPRSRYIEVSVRIRYIGVLLY